MQTQVPHNEPFVHDGHLQRFCCAFWATRGARSSPLGKSAGRRILKGLRPQYNGKC